MKNLFPVSALLFASIIFQSTLRAEAAVAATAAQATPLAVGERAPGALVKTAAGDDFDLGRAIAGKPTLLLFYRGGWCPYCNTQLVKLQSYHERFAVLGFQVLALSTDAPGSLAATTEKTRASFTLLSDREMKAASAYKLAWRVPAENAARYASRSILLAPIPGSAGEHWLPVPAVFVIGPDGVIKYVFADPDFKTRAPAAKIFEAAQAAVK